MFLKAKRLLFPAYIKFSKRLLSNEVRNVLNIRLDSTSETNENNLQLAFISKNLNALNLDLFVNNLSQHEDKSATVLDLLAKLRLTNLASSCLESTHFGVVRHLLENLPVQEVIPVLLDRPKYGIFLNDFTGFVVAQTLHEEKEYILGLPLALKLVLSEETNNAFINWFCLKASLETLKKERPADEDKEKLVSKPPKGKVQETKIRVKFIRNVSEPDIHSEIGKAIKKIESKISDENAKETIKFLGMVLTKNYTELYKAVNQNRTKISTDIADICKNLLSCENQMDIANKIDEMNSQTVFHDLVDKFLNETSIKESSILAEQQKQLFPIWTKQRTEMQLKVEKEMAEKERKEHIEVIGNEIASKKDLLWFFDNEEKLDLEIHNKRVFYPKRWFGKKKKPRAVDEHYVPPQIRRIN